MLTGEQVVLRPVERTDGPAMHAWMNDLAIRDLQCHPVMPMTMAMVERAMQRGNDGLSQIDFAILHRLDDALVGFINLTDLDWVSRNAQLGLIIGDRSRQGKGLGRESIALVTDYAFATLGLHRLWLRVLVANTRAVGLYESMGFQREGLLKDHVFRAGRFQDVLLMARVKSFGQTESLRIN